MNGQGTESEFIISFFLNQKLIHSSKHNTRKQEQVNNVKHEEITLKDKK